VEQALIWRTDSDILYLFDASEDQHQIRRTCIDAPKGKQPFGTRANNRLASRIAGKDIDGR
jgi:endonuclease YncB( thermonuclease family)